MEKKQVDSIKNLCHFIQKFDSLKISISIRNRICSEKQKLNKVEFFKDQDLIEIRDEHIRDTQIIF